MNKIIILNLLIIFLSFAIGIYFYPMMPKFMASHWNTEGLVDGYISKFWGLFLMPLISLGLFLLFISIPQIDPLKENVKKFRKYFDFFILILTLFLFYLYLLTIFWNLGLEFNMNLVLPPALGILFFYIGILTEKTKRNWFIGIRTPWTLSNDKVWEKTHKIGGKMFKITGLIAILGMFFGEYAVWFIIIPAIFVAIYTIIYSYFEYKKVIKKK
jgi:uncharacterized membrane protein